MTHTIYYVLRRGNKGIGENGYVNFQNVKKFASIEEAYDWLASNTEAPEGTYAVDTFISRQAE